MQPIDPTDPLLLPKMKELWARYPRAKLSYGVITNREAVNFYANNLGSPMDRAEIVKKLRNDARVEAFVLNAT